MMTKNNNPESQREVENNIRIPVREIGVKAISENLLQSLSAKQKLVLTSRFGIGNGAPKTLEAIGKNLNITRERVRQIEGDAIKALGKTTADDSTKALAFQVKEIIEETGGIILSEKMLKRFFLSHFGKNEFSENEARIAEILFLFVGLKKNKSNREIRDSWLSPNFDKNYFKDITSEIEKIFDAGKKILDTESLLKKLLYGELVQKYPNLKPEHVISFLEVSKKFGKNVFDDWGKAKWPLVRPRGVREKSTLVLMKKRKPLHFREISKLIGEMGLSQKKVHPQTVHNELIRDKRFVLVGRGTYALREWGFEEGTVKDVIAKLLMSAGNALEKDKIYESVLKKRKVKKATIAVNLADRRLFEKKGNIYKLKDISYQKEAV